MQNMPFLYWNMHTICSYCLEICKDMKSFFLQYERLCNYFLYWNKQEYANLFFCNMQEYAVFYCKMHEYAILQLIYFYSTIAIQYNRFADVSKQLHSNNQENNSLNVAKFFSYANLISALK